MSERPNAGEQRRWRRRAAALATALLAVIAGCAGAAGPSGIDSSVDVAVERGDSADCDLVVDADVADGELVTIVQRDGAGVADTTTFERSVNVSRPAYQGANVTVYAVNPQTENASTLYRGEISTVLAEECGIERAEK